MTRSLVALAIVVMLAGCGSSSTATQISPSPSSSPTGSPLTLKPALAGLLDRDGPPPPAYTSAFGGFVVNVRWSDLQPSAGAEIAAGNAIDQAIATLRSIDLNGRMGLKIRLFAGVYAPLWVKSLGGAPIAVVDPSTGASGTVGRFWSTAYGSGYADLMAKMAARYDSVREVREVVISRCSTVYAEPFIRDASSSKTVSSLLAAGFTVAADEQCQREEIAAHAVWLHTRSDLSFNPYQLIDGSGHTDEAFTERMMVFCRATLGPRCVLANNSLRTPLQFPEMYSKIAELGPPIAFQTAVMAKVGDLGTTLESAISLGAGSVELPGGFQKVGLTALTDYGRRLAAQSTA